MRKKSSKLASKTRYLGTRVVLQKQLPQLLPQQPQAQASEAQGLQATARTAKGLPQQLQAKVTSHHRIKRFSPNFACIAKIPKSTTCATVRGLFWDPGSARGAKREQNRGTAQKTNPQR